jgi:heptosyltransferase III
MKRPSRILVCRTDSIGDVMVTLPMVGWIKHNWPEIKVDFAGKAYTQAVIEACPLVDHFINADEWLAMPVAQAKTFMKARNYDVALFAFPDPEWMKVIAAAGIPVRIATASRWASWKWANRRVWFSRKNSDLHEAQLNLHLLRPLGITIIPSLQELVDVSTFMPNTKLPASFEWPQRPFVILHPKSKGSAVEWGVEAFMALAERLMSLNYDVVITGTAAEGETIRSEVPNWPVGLIDRTGQLSLSELIAFIAKAKALVAASTGPLHIAAALGIRSIGLYTPQRPMHPGRWAPLGRDTRVLVAAEHPVHGQKLAISIEEVIKAIEVE